MLSRKIERANVKLMNEGIVSQIHPPELQWKKDNASESDSEASVLDLHLSTFYGFVSSKMYNKHDSFYFHIVNIHFLGGDVPRRNFYGVCKVFYCM